MDPKREDLPRISVDTIQEWQHVKAQYTDAMIASLDARLAAKGKVRQHDRDLFISHLHQVWPHDPSTLFARGLLYLWQYIDAVFGIAKPNLRVNGRNFEELDGNDEGTDCHPMRFSECLLTLLTAVEIEPFDEALDRHIWSLSDQRLKWDREIARTRTDKPREVETMLQDLFDRHHEAGAQDMNIVVEAKDDREFSIQRVD
jgi:hypothetical protein